MIPPALLRETLETTYRAQYSSLVWGLRARFDVLTEPECEDLVQFAFLQATKMLSRPDFQVTHTWKAWLQRVAINAALSYLRRLEERSLDSLAAESADGDGSEPGSQPISDRGALTPSQMLAVAERGERRRLLVSDLLRDYIRHVETYQMWTQAEVFERSLRGQNVAQISAEMRLNPQRTYEYRARAFQWLRTQCEQRDARGSILASAFEPTPARESDDKSHLHPRRMADVIRWAVDTVGALCPSPSRLAAAGPEIDYHVRSSRWVEERHSNQAQAAPGCRHCRAALADAAAGDAAADVASE